MFEVEFQVRDYECDIQGIVNNAIYQHYFEHARHTFLNQKGINFFQITQSGILLVIYRSEIDYLISLSNDKLFKVTVEFQRLSKIKGLFEQKIFVKDQIYTQGKFYITALNSKNKPINLNQINIDKLCID